MSPSVSISNQINVSQSITHATNQSGIKHGYVLFDLHTKEICISSHVVFHEYVLPYKSNSSSQSHDWEYFTSLSNSSNKSSELTSPITTSSLYRSIVPSSSTDIVPHIDPVISNLPSLPTSPPIIRQSSGNKSPPSYLQDYICHNKSHSFVNNAYSISNYISYHNISNPHSHFILSLHAHTEPKSYVEATQFECWRQAMQVKLTAHENTGTWKIIDLPSHAKPIGCMWIYKIKHHAHGSIERYKARLVVKGYNQVEGLNYFDTYSPVAKHTTIILVLALASLHK